jgi:outer membrane protein TolC
MMLITAVVVVFFMNGSAPAQTAMIAIASVDEAIARAHRFGPELDEYALRYDQASRQYNAVRFHWLPTVSTAVSAQWNGSLPVTPVPGEIFGRPGETADVQFGKTYAHTVGLTLSQSVLDLQAWYVAESAEAAAKSAQASISAYRQHLTEQVALHYYTAVIAKALLSKQQESLTDSAKLVALVESRFDQGVVDQSAVNRARINQNTVRQDETNYRDVLDQAVTNLRILLGIPAETPLKLAEHIAPDTPEPMVVDDLGPDRRLLVDEFAVAQARYQWMGERALRWPKLMLDSYIGSQQLQDRLELSFDSDEWAKTQWVKLTLSVPIFTGLSRRNQTLAAEAAYNLALKSYARKREEAGTIDANLLARRRLYRQQVGTTRQNLELTRNNASLALHKYEQGVIGLEQYLTTREDQRRAESAYLNSLLTYYRLVATFISRRP